MDGKKCEITAFLSLVFILLVSFVLGILEITIIRTSGNLSRLEADRAVFSIFGEYQTKLLKDYHIFALEGSYGTGEFDEDKVISRMHYYGGEAEYEVSKVQFLTDDEGQSFREQVLEYMEQRYGVSAVGEFFGMTEEWIEQSIRGEEIKTEENRIMEEYQDIRRKQEEVQNMEEGTDTAGIPEEENPFTCLEQIEKSGLLSLVLPAEMELSGRMIVPSDQASVRELRSGRGTFPVRQGTDGIEERLLFNEYILKKFTCAAMDKENENDREKGEEKEKSLSYEVEYILSGKSSDKENLESVLTKLFFMRMALNYASLLGDSARQSEASALAVVLSSLLLMPEASEAVKQLILAAWAAGESVVDIRTLLTGRKVPAVKNSENWVLPLSGLFTLGIGSEQVIAEDTSGGISYEGYLRTLLFLKTADEVTMRALDRIEENLDLEYGMDYFRADQCITKIGFNSTARLFGEITYKFPIYFGYQ